jgi:uncharacterized protein YraI
MITSRAGGRVARAAVRAALCLIVGAGALLAADVAAAAQFDCPTTGRLTSTYYSPRSYGNHAALDIAASSGTPIHAARGGTVSFRGWSGGYGRLVIIDHGSGYQTYYAHMSRYGVERGDTVSGGEVIGYVGSSGNSTGPHLHFEVRRWRSKQYLPGSGGDRVTQGRGIAHTYPGLSSTTGGENAPATTDGLTSMRVTASVLNVRTGPGAGYRLLGAVRRDQVYVATESQGGWYRIWYDGRQGWANGGHLSVAGGVGKHEVSSRALHVRSGPGSGYSRVGSAPRGSVFAVHRYSGSWGRIHYSGAAAWFHTGYTEDQ